MIDCLKAAERLGDYRLIDSGGGEKLERVAGRLLRRPAPQAVWPRDEAIDWRGASAFRRDKTGYGRWQPALPKDGWAARVFGLEVQLRATRFGHLGLFPEMCGPWGLVEEMVEEMAEGAKVLNLFAYTGMLSLVAARAGAEVAHVDAAKGTVDWARRNAQVAGLAEAPIRWLVDDARKFVARELRRGKRYEVVVLDPPTFGRGAGKEEWKIERDLVSLVDDCRALLSDRARLLLLTCHTPGLTGSGLVNLLPSGAVGGELLLASHGGAKVLPSGAYAAWVPGA